MSEEEGVAEVTLPAVRVPADLKKIVDELKYMTLKGDKLRLYNVSDIMREALLKGLRLMLVEREVFDTIIEKEAREGAERLYISLVNSSPAPPKIGTGETVGATRETPVPNLEDVEKVSEEEKEEETETDEEGEGEE